MAGATQTEADPGHDETLDRPSADPSTRDGDGQGLASHPELVAGSRIGDRYEVIRRLGEGGMGTVYEAEHTAIRRRVAVKVLHAEFGRNPSVIERFLQEARAVNAVRHRHVVEVFDFGVDNARPWLVMELLSGESLGARIERQGPGDPAWAVRTLDPLCRALHQAHQRGFIHRDVKPDNVFLAREEGTVEDVPKLLDFGIAKNVLQDQKLTATGAMIGTPAYMAPEQITNPREVTAACDQYALGVMLYEMLTGRLPHEAASFHGLLLGKVSGACVPITSQRSDLPGTLASVVMRTLSLDPANRFPDLDALRSALLGSLTAERPEAVPEPVPEPVPERAAPAPEPIAHAPAAHEPPAPPPIAHEPTAPARSGLRIAALILLPLLLVALLVGLSLLPSPPPPATALLPRPTPIVAAPPPPPEPVAAPPTVAPAPVIAAPSPELRPHRPRATSPRPDPRATTGHPGRLQIDTHNPLRP